MVGGAFRVRNWPITQSRRGCPFESSLRKRHVRLSDSQQTGLPQRTLCRFDIRKQLFVGQQVPDSLAFPFFNGNHAQQPVATLELKNQIVARNKIFSHLLENLSILWSEGQLQLVGPVLEYQLQLGFSRVAKPNHSQYSERCQRK